MPNSLMIKTDYSILKSVIKIKDLGFFNAKVIGIIDDNLNYVMEFYNYAQKNNIKPLIGLDVILNCSSIYLYALNQTGYYNLININNSIDKDINLLEKYSKDVLCLLTYDKYNEFESYNKIFDIVYLGYSNEKEKKEALNITKNIVFANEIRVLKKEDTKLLIYLDVIKNGGDLKKSSEDFSLFYPFDINTEDEKTFNSFAALFNFQLEFNDFHIPKIENGIEKIKSLIRKGLTKRLNNNVTNEYIERIKYELNTIIEMNYVDYFLIVYDYVLFAKKNNILVGPGRGSAAGSLVCYALGITEIDPLKYNLLFERFLNKERVSLPDIDLDFEYDKRDIVIDYIKKKYGLENVALIITYGTMKSRQVIRDVAKVIDLGDLLLNNLLKYIDQAKCLEDNYTQDVKKFLKQNNMEDFYKTCLKLENIKRHVSTHAAGLIISDKNISKLIPVTLSGTELLAGFTYEYLEQVKLIKMDLLALKNLTIVSNVLEAIKEKEKLDIKLADIPFNDSKTLKLFSDVDTKGIFQFESTGMMNFLQKLKVNNFNDLINAVALFRPGPMNNINSFIKRKEGLEKIDYFHPSLEKILESTYGIIVYQEQVIQILNKMASYSYAESDIIRRAMSKKKKEIIESERERFIQKSLKNGYELSVINRVFDYILNFAGYGFNKAHSVSYAALGYQMGYLKSNYPLYYMQNLLNMSIGSGIKTKEYLFECRKYDILVLKPDINLSSKNYEIIDNKKILMPLTTIKNIGSNIGDAICLNRKAKGYKDYYDFIRVMYQISINKSIIETLIRSGALDTFKINRKTMIMNLDSIYNYAELINNLDESLVEKPMLVEYEEYKTEELITDEVKLFDFFINNHPVTKYKNKIKINELNKYFDKVIEGCFLVENIKKLKTKKGEDMAFVDISDETSSISAIVFREKVNLIESVEINSIIKLKGKVEKRFDKYQIIANSIEKI